MVYRNRSFTGLNSNNIINRYFPNWPFLGYIYISGEVINTYIIYTIILFIFFNFVLPKYMVTVMS